MKEQYKHIKREELVNLIIDREYAIINKDTRIKNLEEQNNLIKYTLDNLFKVMNGNDRPPPPPTSTQS